MCQFLLHSKVNQLYVYTYLLFLGFPSHLGIHRGQSSLCYTVDSDQLSVVYNTQQCICVNPNLPIHPNLLSPLVSISLFSTYLCLYFCFVNKFIYYFSRFYICLILYRYYTVFVFLFLTYFTLYDSLGPSTSLPMEEFYSFFWLRPLSYYVLRLAFTHLKIIM